MVRQTQNWHSVVIIIVCILFSQSIAHFATSTGQYILRCLAFYTILVQWIAFIHAGGFFGNERTERYYDLTGSITILTTLAFSLYNVGETLNARQIILSSFAAIWGARLGWYLYTRCIGNNGIDSRFTIVKPSRVRFLMNWTLQGVWVFISVLPVLIINKSKEKFVIGLLDYIGISLWIIGFSLEVVADHQKITWQKLVENKNKFINTGLWTISRHPNYFGEILLWIGIALSAFNGTSGPRSYIVFLTPIFVAFVLVFISGIYLLEKKKDKEFAKDHAYQRYKKLTPALIPFIGRAGDASF